MANSKMATAPGRAASNDLDRARDALYSIPADLPREVWMKLGMGAQDIGIDFDTFDNWSAAAPSYNAQDCRSMWKSFKPGKGVGAGTFFKIASEYGSAGTKTPRQVIDFPAIVKPKAAPRPGMSATEVWSRMKPATVRHPYVVEKDAAGADLSGLRVVPEGDSLQIMNQGMAGFLVVPAYAPDGTMQSLQFIPPNGGKKFNLPGHPMSGASFTVGPPDGPATLVEGIGQAWAAWKPNGHRAVVGFGCDNVGKVARNIRQAEPDALLTICLDVGQEEKADKIGKEFNASVVKMPEGEAKNFDISDLARRDGMDALAELLESAVEQPKPEPHPLAKYVDYDAKPKATRWVIPGFIGHGVVIIAGAPGVGKTTALLPLAMVAAGLHGPHDELAPKHWRHIVYIVEDVEQAKRIVAGIVGHGNLGIDAAVMCERLHIVEARRLDPIYVAQVGKVYREQFTRIVNGVEVLPLVVMDTNAAILDLENENDNSEASKAIAALKQGFEGLPVWLVGHVSKQNFGRSNVADLSSRGAGAFEGDSNQVLYLVKENETRYLERGKTRFEAKWQTLEIQSHCADTIAEDEYGDFENVTLRWAVVAPPAQSRREARELATEQSRKDETAELREEVRKVIEEAHQGGFPLSRTGVRAKVGGQTTKAGDCIQNLLDEQWIYEVEVPAKERTNSNRKSFLVNFTTAEHEAILRDGEIPAAKLVIPASWKKSAIPFVPEPERTDGGKEDVPEEK